MPDRLIPRLNGPRGSFLLFIGGLALLHAISCLFDDVALPFGLDVLNETVPLPIYAAIWIAAAVLAAIAAFRRPDRTVREAVDVWAFSTLAAMFTIWGGTYLLGALLAPRPTQWIFAGVYLFIAGGVAAAGRMINPHLSEVG